MASQQPDRKWSGKVTETSDALDLEEDIFKSRSARRIAASLKRSAEQSHRRKSSSFQSAMSMLRPSGVGLVGRRQQSQPREDENMGREVELKLEVPPSAIDAVARLPWLSEVSKGPATHKELVTVYFDTAKSKLRKHGLALRVRHAGGNRVQTIKALDKGARAGFGRDEWEERIAGDTPNLKLAEGTALEPLATKKLERKLKPVFETVVERTAFPIHSGDADLELAVDRGHIKAREWREPVSEVEIELKRGDRDAIEEIAERLAKSAPVAYAAQSKPERGYALSAGEAGTAVCRGTIDLDPEVSTAAAFQTIALSCLDHAAANERTVRERDTEGVHQMRVGLRRLRAAISIFKELLPGQETEAVKTELKWLTKQLGPARDFDVLLEQRVNKERRVPPIAGNIDVLEADLQARRDAGLQKAKAAVNSDRYRALGLRTALWVANGEWSKSAEPLTVARRERRAVEVAAEILDKRSKKISRKVRGLEALGARQRHKLRIAVKKLRYACEFFAGLFDSRKQTKERKRFASILKRLQGSLGTLNDFEVHKRLAVTIAQPRKRSRKQGEKALAMGFITGQEQQQIASCIVAAEKTGKQLSSSAKFWQTGD
jgi:inorganic triphosphatase YgiF